MSQTAPVKCKKAIKGKKQTNKCIILDLTGTISICYSWFYIMSLKKTSFHARNTISNKFLKLFCATSTLFFNETNICSENLQKQLIILCGYYMIRDINKSLVHFVKIKEIITSAQFKKLFLKKQTYDWSGKSWL